MTYTVEYRLDAPATTECALVFYADESGSMVQASGTGPGSWAMTVTGVPSGTLARLNANECSTLDSSQPIEFALSVNITGASGSLVASNRWPYEGKSFGTVNLPCP